MRKELVRTKQALSEEKTQEILRDGVYGVLALNGDDGYLYSVPLSYILYDGSIYFHGSPRGYKHDCFARTKKTSFSVVGQSEVVPKLRANNYKSVTVWGTLEPVTDLNEKQEALLAMADKYSKGVEDNEEEIQHSLQYVFMMKLVPECITGKEADEEVRKAGKLG